MVVGAGVVLATDCIYTHNRIPEEIRICVMRRTTLDDGKTQDPNIGLGITHDRFWPELGAPGPVIWNWLRNGKHLRGNAKQRFWDAEFEPKYLEYLKKMIPSRKMEELARLARTEITTVLCKEEDDRFCHRRLLGEEFQRRYPEITFVSIKRL